MSTDRIEIGRDDLFTAEVDAAVDRARAARRREPPRPADLPGWRRLLMDPMFYLPLAGALATLGTWGALEPFFADFALVGGEVAMVNSDPFDVPGTSLTVGRTEVIFLPGMTRLERGADGQPAFASIDEVVAGAWVEAAGEEIGEKRVVAVGLRPATRERALASASRESRRSEVIAAILLPVTAACIALFLIFAEGVTTRHWRRMVNRAFLGTLLAVVFAFVAYVPVGVILTVAQAGLESGAGEGGVFTAQSLRPGWFIVMTAARSCAWACMGVALGAGMSLIGGTRQQVRNAILGGALGGAAGGLFFDPIDRFFKPDTVFSEAALSRAIGLLAVGICVGIFVALVERLAREAWVRVRTGPLAGKSFVLYRSPTTIGSSPEADIYLFKDPEISPRHAAIHRIGNSYEIEDLDSRHGTKVAGEGVRRRRLASGDRIELGSTLLDFEERAPRKA